MSETIHTPNPFRRRNDRRSVLRTTPLSPIGDIANATLSKITGATTLTWETASDWDSAVSEVGVAHYNYGDYAGDATVQLGLPATDQTGSALEGFYGFDENSGTTVNDAVGGNDGTYYGSPTLGNAGDHNTDAFGLDGSDDAAEMPALPNINSTECSLIQLANYSSGGTLTQVGGDRNNAPTDGYTLKIQGDARQIVGWTGGGYNTNACLNTKNVGVWEVSVIRWNGNTFKFDARNPNDGSHYADSPTSASVSRGTGSSTPPVVGGGDTGFMSGDVAFSRYYSRRLSDSEVNTVIDGLTSGTLTTATKSFATSVSPDLSSLSYSLNGESITLDVIGSPGTGSEEIVSQSLGGASSYTLSWSSSHTDFRVKINIDTTDFRTSPTIGRIGLTQ